MLRSAPLGPEPDARPDPAAAARDADRTALAADLAAFQRRIGALEPAVRGAESLARPDAAVVVAGQQPGLLGGPLLTVLKALTAIAWARRLAAESGRPVVPVFWAATEDHDLTEVNRVTVLDASDEPRTLTLPLEHDGRMLSEIDPGAGADVLLDEVAATLPASTWTERVVESLRETRAPSLGEWFVRLIARWLSGEGLVVVEPGLFRTAAAPILERERKRPGEIAAACVPDGPVEVAPTPFFLFEEGRRVRPGSASELPADPRGISFDVVTRVLAQNLVLPVAGHVVGPTEERYCRQIAPAHALFGIPAPPLLPRASLVLLEGKIDRSLAAFDADLSDVLERGADALSTDLRPEEFDRALAELETKLSEAAAAVRDEAERMDETLVRKTAGAEKEILKAVERLRGHGRRALERATGRDAERRRKVLAHLLPGGKPQDRELSPLPFLARHGFGLLRRLLAVVQEWPGGRRAVHLSEEVSG